MVRGEGGCTVASWLLVNIANETASWAVASIAWAMSIDRPDALTLVIAALRRGYEAGEEVEVIEVPVWDGKGDDR
jgi:hypothetical protein